MEIFIVVKRQSSSHWALYFHVLAVDSATTIRKVAFGKKFILLLSSTLLIGTGIAHSKKYSIIHVRHSSKIRPIVEYRTLSRNDNDRKLSSVVKYLNLMHSL